MKIVVVPIDAHVSENYNMIVRYRTSALNRGPLDGETAARLYDELVAQEAAALTIEGPPLEEVMRELFRGVAPERRGVQNWFRSSSLHLKEVRPIQIEINLIRPNWSWMLSLTRLRYGVAETMCNQGEIVGEVDCRSTFS